MSEHRLASVDLDAATLPAATDFGAEFSGGDLCPCRPAR